MQIEIKRQALIIEADNVRIEEAAFEPIYVLKEDGKKDLDIARRINYEQFAQSKIKTLKALL